MAFVDVNVVPMDTERVLPNQTVVIEGGRITAMGPASQIPVPPGATRIDGRGKYLIPGLADMHAHFLPSAETYEERTYRLFSFLANGVTTVRHINGIPADEERVFMHFKTGEIPAPRLYIAGVIRGLKSTTLDSVAAYVATHKMAGYDFLSIPTNYASYRGEGEAGDSLLAAARRLSLPVSSHSHVGSFEQMLAFGAHGGSIEHLYPFWDTLARSGMTATASEIEALAAATHRAGVWITPTMDCLEHTTSYGLKDIPSTQTTRQIVKALQDAGVRLLLGADGDSEYRRSPTVVHHELAALIRAGLTPYQALVTGTRNVAQYLGVLDKSGTVAVGKQADLVLLNGNPLLEISHTREPAGAMIGGRWLDRATLDRHLLAFPNVEGRIVTSWIKLAVQGDIRPRLTQEQGRALKVNVKAFEALTDSLKLASARPEDQGSHKRIVQQLAEEIRTMRTLLTPEQHANFDPAARVWLREQARQGYSVTVPGIVSTP